MSINKPTTKYVLLIGSNENAPEAIAMRAAGYSIDFAASLDEGAKLQAGKSYCRIIMDPCILNGNEGTATISPAKNLNEQQEQSHVLDLAHVMIRDMDDHIIFWNKGAEDFYGFTTEEAVGRTPHELLKTIFPVSLEETADNLRRDGIWQGELIHTKKDCSIVTVSSHQVVHKDASGRPTAILEVNNDITNLKQLQDTLYQALQELDVRSEEIAATSEEMEALNDELLLEIKQRELVEQALRESEQHIKEKLDSILSPDGDIGNLELADIIDTEAVQALIESFHKFANIPMALIDIRGKVLVGVGWQDICTKFHRVNPETCKHCIESDIELSLGAEPGHSKLYKCKNHMWDVATPIIVGGKHVGNLFSGQIFFGDETPDYEIFRAQAKKYGFDENEYIAALDRVPRVSREALNEGMLFFSRLAGLISKLSYSNIMLARTLAEREQAQETLIEAMQELDVRAEELAVMNEELTTSNEEIEAVNEDLRIANKDLQQEIAQRNQAEDKLKSMALFPDENPNPVIRISATGELLYANPASKTALGIPDEPGFLLPKEILDLAAEALSSGREKEVIRNLRNRTFSLVFAPISRNYVNLYGRDITRRKQAEDAVIESNKRLSLLYDTASELLLTENPQSLVQSLCEKVMDTLGCHAFFNFLVDEERDCLHLNASAGIPEEAVRSIEWLDYGVAVCGCVAQEGCRIVAEDIFNTPDPRTELVKGYGIQAYACHPLLGEAGKVIGTLSFGSRTKPSFTNDELDLMKAVAGQVATAMERIRLLDEERSRAEELQAVLDAVPAGVWISRDPECNNIIGNYAANKIFEAEEGENLSATNSSVRRIFRDGQELTPKDLPMQYSAAHNVEVDNAEFEIQLPSGNWRVIWGSATPLRNQNGEVRGSVAVFVDITDRKRAEQRERDLEAHKQDFYRRTILAATQGKLQISESDEIIKLAGSAIAQWPVATLNDLGDARDAIMSILKSKGMDKGRASGFIGCVVEAMANAYKHASGGTVSLHTVSDSFVAVIADSGPGIEALALPDVALRKGYTTAISLGMGYKVMTSIADKVYLATRPGETVVAIEMTISPKQADATTDQPLVRTC